MILQPQGTSYYQDKQPDQADPAIRRLATMKP